MPCIGCQYTIKANIEHWTLNIEQENIEHWTLNKSTLMPEHQNTVICAKMPKYPLAICHFSSVTFTHFLLCKNYTAARVLCKNYIVSMLIVQVFAPRAPFFQIRWLLEFGYNGTLENIYMQYAICNMQCCLVTLYTVYCSTVYKHSFTLYNGIRMVNRTFTFCFNFVIFLLIQNKSKDKRLCQKTIPPHGVPRRCCTM